MVSHNAVMQPLLHACRTIMILKLAQTMLLPNRYIHVFLDYIAGGLSSTATIPFDETVLDACPRLKRLQSSSNT